MARTVTGVKQNKLDRNDDSPRRSPRKKIIKETDKSPRKKTIKNNDKSPRRSPRKRKREDGSEDETKVIDDNAAKRRRIRDHITSAYNFSQRYNCSFALIIQVEGSSDILVAGIGYTLGLLRKKKQIRNVRWNPPPTKGKYSPSREVCKNVKMNECIKPRVTKVKNKQDNQKKTSPTKRKTSPTKRKTSPTKRKTSPTKRKTSPTKNTSPTKKKTSPTKQPKDSNCDKSPEKRLGKTGARDEDSSLKPCTSGVKIAAKPSTSQEKQDARKSKEKSGKQTWDASSETEGLLEKKKSKLSKKKEKLDIKMPPNGTIKRAVFAAPTKKSEFSLL